ncbi:MAG: hypothetical protein R3E77_12720 [Steroidobacteraceae bacterium]
MVQALKLRRPLLSGEVLDLGLRLFMASIVKCLPVALAVQLVGQLASIQGFLLTGRGARPAADPLWWSLMLVAFAAAAIGLALIMRLQTATGTAEFSFAAAARATLRQASPVVAIAIAVVLAVAAGLALLVLPGVYLMVALSMAMPSLVNEGLAPLPAMRRSFSLIRGHWWRTASMLLVALVAVIVVYFVLWTVVLLVAQLFGAADLALVSALTAVVLAIVGATLLPLFAALLLVMHADLVLRSALAGHEGKPVAA